MHLSASRPSTDTKTSLLQLPFYLSFLKAKYILLHPFSPVIYHQQWPVLDTSEEEARNYAIGHYGITCPTRESFLLTLNSKRFATLENDIFDVSMEQQHHWRIMQVFHHTVPPIYLSSPLEGPFLEVRTLFSLLVHSIFGLC